MSQAHLKCDLLTLKMLEGRCVRNGPLTDFSHQQTVREVPTWTTGDSVGDSHHQLTPFDQTCPRKAPEIGHKCAEILCDTLSAQEGPRSPRVRLTTQLFPTRQLTGMTVFYLCHAEKQWASSALDRPVPNTPQYTTSSHCHCLGLKRLDFQVIASFAPHVLPRP